MALTDEDLMGFLSKVMVVERRYASEERNVASRRKADIKELVERHAELFAETELKAAEADGAA